MQQDPPKPAPGPILVFGAAGQVGRELLALASSRGVPAVGLAREEADITRHEEVEAAIQRFTPSVIVNAAAYTAVDKAETHAAEAMAINGGGAAHLARAAHQHAVPLIHISTDYVFDGRKTCPYVEEDPIAPLSVYGRSKAAGEEAVAAEIESHVILRTAWVYGIYGANFLKTMLRLGRERDRLRVVDDQRGCPTATRDIAEALLVVARNQCSPNPARGIFHFAGPDEMSWYTFAETIFAAQDARIHRRPALEPIGTADYPTAATRPMNSVLDSRLFQRTFGYTPAPCRQRVAEAVNALLNEGRENG